MHASPKVSKALPIHPQAEAGQVMGQGDRVGPRACPPTPSSAGGGHEMGREAAWNSATQAGVGGRPRCQHLGASSGTPIPAG